MMLKYPNLMKDILFSLVTELCWSYPSSTYYRLKSVELNENPGELRDAYSQILIENADLKQNVKLLSRSFFEVLNDDRIIWRNN